MTSRYVVYRDDVLPWEDGLAQVRQVLTESFGCTYLTETVLSIAPGTTGLYRSGVHEEVLFVLHGRGRLLLGGEACEFGPESGIYVAPGETYRFEVTEAAEIVSVQVAEPASDVETGQRRTVSLLDEQEIGHATAGREYRILADPSTGFRSGTHFVGDVPTGEPAPLHYHLYNEVIYILQGNGILHIDGEKNPIYPGACIHLPARTLHQVENTGDVPMREVAVFVPAGSPAAAYLPDGTSAYPGVPDDPQSVSG